MDDRLPWSDQHLFHEGAHERPGLGNLACSQELAHVLGEGGDRVGAVQERAALGQPLPRLPGGELQLLPSLPVLLDALGSVGIVEVRALDEAPDAVQLLALFHELKLNALQPLSLLAGDAVHLLVHHPHQLADVALREDVIA